MPGEHSLFDGEWWWPRWSSSSLPLPPEPLEPSILCALQADLELGMGLPLEKPENYSQEDHRSSEPLLRTYPDRLLRASESWAKWEPLLDMHQPIRYFRVLRYYDLNLITHKLHHMQKRLEAKSVDGLSNKENQELTKLLQDQGILSVLDNKDVF